MASELGGRSAGSESARSESDETPYFFAGTAARPQQASAPQAVGVPSRTASGFSGSPLAAKADCKE